MQGKPTILGTATPGGGFPLYGGVFAEALNAADPTLAIETKNTKGSTENVPLLEAGSLDIALVQGEVANPALANPATGLRVIAAMYSSPGMFVVRADSPVHAIADLKGQTVAFGAKGSGLTILGRTVIDGLGLDAARDFNAVYLDKAGDGPLMVLAAGIATEVELNVVHVELPLMRRCALSVPACELLTANESRLSGLNGNASTPQYVVLSNRV